MGIFEPKWADELQTKIRHLYAKAEQNPRAFGPMALRNEINNAIVQAFDSRMNGITNEIIQQIEKEEVDPRD